MILIDKPKGISSFDVIRRLRRVFGMRKMGHAGTLDPLASGLMLVAVGSETKKLKEYVGLSKTYNVSIILGERRSTGDMEGEIVEEQLVTSVDEDLLRSVAAGMCGVLDLPVPVYSAVKQGGTPLYKKARRGENVVLPIKPMEIHTFEIQNYACAGGRCRMEANIHVGSGTYVRSVVEEFGKRLGYPATVGELRRVSVGAYRVEDASDLDDTEALTKALRTYEEDSQK